MIINYPCLPIYLFFAETLLVHPLATLLCTPCWYRVWPTFAFRTALILCGIDSTMCWKHSSEILVDIDAVAAKFVGCTSMMRISCYTTSQRCSIGLRSGDCGGHLTKVNSFSCSRNQSEMTEMSCEVKSCVFVKYNNDAFFFYFKPLLPAKIPAQNHT